MRLRNSVLAEVLLIALVYGARRSVHLAEARGHGFAYMVWDDSDWETATYAGRLVAWLRESAPHPVHSTTLVFPAADLDAVSLAGVADRPRLVAIHPDRAGGLGFLSTVTYAFAPLLRARECC
jgi:hypothetical protein